MLCRSEMDVEPKRVVRCPSCDLELPDAVLVEHLEEFHVGKRLLGSVRMNCGLCDFTFMPTTLGLRAFIRHCALMSHSSDHIRGDWDTFIQHEMDRITELVRLGTRAELASYPTLRDDIQQRASSKLNHHLQTATHSQIESPKLKQKKYIPLDKSPKNKKRFLAPTVNTSHINTPDINSSISNTPTFNTPDTNSSIISNTPNIKATSKYNTKRKRNIVTPTSGAVPSLANISAISSVNTGNESELGPGKLLAQITGQLSTDSNQVVGPEYASGIECATVKMEPMEEESVMESEASVFPAEYSKDGLKLLGVDSAAKYRARGSAQIQCHNCSTILNHSTKKDLIRHVMTHEQGLRPFRCANCDYTTTQKWNMGMHIRSKFSQENGCDGSYVNIQTEEMKERLGELALHCFPTFPWKAGPNYADYLEFIIPESLSEMGANDGLC